MITNPKLAVASGATAYDQQNKRYFCWGFNASNSKRLYVMDIDDSTSNNFNLTSVPAIEIEYDLQHQKLYGLWWDGSMEHFGEIDTQTGQATSILLFTWCECSGDWKLYIRLQYRKIYLYGCHQNKPNCTVYRLIINILSINVIYIRI